MKYVGLDVCPYCRSKDVQITETRHEYEYSDYSVFWDLACQDMECEECGRIWTVEHRPVRYFLYAADNETFINEPRQFLPVGEQP